MFIYRIYCYCDNDNKINKLKKKKKMGAMRAVRRKVVISDIHSFTQTLLEL